MKANQTVSYEIDMDQEIITFNVKGQSAIVLHMEKLHQDNINYAAYVGLAQVRVVDGAAIGRADKEGNLIPEPERLRRKYDGMKRIVDHLESGSAEWNLKVRMEKETDHGLTLRAMEVIFKRDRAGVEAAIKTWIDNGHGTRGKILDSFAARSDIAEAIRGFRADLTAGIDTGKMMEELIGQE